MPRTYSGPDAHTLELAIRGLIGTCVLCGNGLQRLATSPRNAVWLESHGYMPLYFGTGCHDGLLYYGLPASRMPETGDHRERMVCAYCQELPPETLKTRLRAFALWLSDTEKQIKRLHAAQNAADAGSHKRMSAAEQASATLSGMLAKRTGRRA